MALWGQAAASVANNEHFEAILQRRERWEGHTGFRKESRNDQSPAVGRDDCISGRVILPDVHASALDRFYGRKSLLQRRKQGTAVDSRCGCRCDDWV